MLLLLLLLPAMSIDAVSAHTANGVSVAAVIILQLSSATDK
jgi:hypothetical protein